jgi:hypothetical protein
MSKIFEEFGDAHQTYVSFSLWDSKGREIGARLTMWIGEVIEADHGYTSIEDYPAGTSCIRAVFESMRGGESFGAWKGYRYFRSTTAAREAFDAYLVGARKRAWKNAA